MKTAAIVWILGDQLLETHPALLEAERAHGRDAIQIVLIESAARISKLPYQKKKLILLLSAMRHYADQLKADKWRVTYLQTQDTFEDALREQLQKSGATALYMMAASEYDTRQMQQTLIESLDADVHLLPNTQFLVETVSHPGKSGAIIMEQFYRSMRRQFGVLMEKDGKSPVDGAWNFDKQNRKSLPKDIQPPPLPVFPPDSITQQVIDHVGTFPHTVGKIEDFRLAVTRHDALTALDDFIRHRLPLFGDYEDAMSAEHSVLFHSLLSPYVNIGLLEPMEMIRAAESAYNEGHAPINAVEGFIRQILGWREFMYWQYWQQMPDLRTANGWNATRQMPMMFWDGNTEMNCIKHVVERLIEGGYSHHIERLMIVCNFCLLAGINPAEVNEWFLVFYDDAYDWVVTPNVIGMGLNADGGKIGTNPYIASANYINKMSDYCHDCHFKAKQRLGEDACPYNYLYWNFLITHEARLRSNPRLGQMVLGLGRISSEERTQIQAQANDFLDGLAYYEK